MSARQPQARRTVVIYNVKYSPNLGDGLIAECLEWGLSRALPQLLVQSCDLAGRTAYTRGSHNRRYLLRALAALPEGIRQRVTRLALDQLINSRLDAHFASAAKQAEAIVVGGGNLLADHDLNFPKKIGAAMHAARQRQLPVFIHACGVTDGWTKEGRRIFSEAFGPGNLLRGVTVRDQASKRLWDADLGAMTGVQAIVVPDPGLLSSRLFPVSPTAAQNKPFTVAIGIMSAAELTYHGSKGWTTRSLSKWYLTLIERLLGSGAYIVLFCNGNPDDRHQLADLQNALDNKIDNSRLSLANVDSPRDLCNVVARVDTVIAHRLHAVIPSYSYGRRILALSWDKKLNSFMEAVGLADCIFDALHVSPVALADIAIGQQQAHAPHATDVQRKVDEAQAGVDLLAQNIRMALQF